MSGHPPSRRALVTGGAVRVGRTLSLSCAALGMDVAVHYRSSPDAAEATAEECRALGVRAVTVAGDLSVSAECRQVVRDAAGALGGLDALVASASTFEPRAFDDIDDDHIDRTLAVNLRAPLLMAQEAAPFLRASGHGRIVLMNDVAGIEPWPRFIVHSISKAGLGMLTRALAQELAPDITVNAIAPGTILMPEGSTDAAARRSVEKTMLQRLGAPDDAAGAMRYLLEADYVTGHTLVVDGGRLVRP
jgi:pteridine reductase